MYVVCVLGVTVATSNHVLPPTYVGLSRGTIRRSKLVVIEWAHFAFTNIVCGITTKCVLWFVICG